MALNVHFFGNGRGVLMEKANKMSRYRIQISLSFSIALFLPALSAQAQQQFFQRSSVPYGFHHQPRFNSQSMRVQIVPVSRNSSSQSRQYFCSLDIFSRTECIQFDQLEENMQKKLSIRKFELFSDKFSKIKERLKQSRADDLLSCPNKTLVPFVAPDSMEKIGSFGLQDAPSRADLPGSIDIFEIKKDESFRAELPCSSENENPNPAEGSIISLDSPVSSYAKQKAEEKAEDAIDRCKKSSESVRKLSSTPSKKDYLNIAAELIGAGVVGATAEGVKIIYDLSWGVLEGMANIQWGKQMISEAIDDATSGRNAVNPSNSTYMKWYKITKDTMKRNSEQKNKNTATKKKQPKKETSKGKNTQNSDSNPSGSNVSDCMVDSNCNQCDQLEAAWTFFKAMCDAAGWVTLECRRYGNSSACIDERQIQVSPDGDYQCSSAESRKEAKRIAQNLSCKKRKWVFSSGSWQETCDQPQIKTIKDTKKALRKKFCQSAKTTNDCNEPYTGRNGGKGGFPNPPSFSTFR